MRTINLDNHWTKIAIVTLITLAAAILTAIFCTIGAQ